MKITSDDMVGNMDKSNALGGTKRTQSEIPDPTFGYLRGSSLEHQKMDDALWNRVVEHDLNKLVYRSHGAEWK